MRHLRIDPFDDMGNAKSPFIVVACIPVHGRIPLLEHTIRRLYQKNGVHKVICVGDGPEERKACEKNGAVWEQFRNKPLGEKWNRAFQAAAQFDPDACLYVGSSDWISDNWLPTMEPYLNEHGFVGTPGCYFMDLGDTIRVCHWPGYNGTRAKETIGIGRLISSDVLKSVKWKPFHDMLDNSLDKSMKDRCGNDYMVLENIKSVSISTNRWANKHIFSQHWNGTLHSTKISDVEGFLKDFPEGKLIFK